MNDQAPHDYSAETGMKEKGPVSLGKAQKDGENDPFLRSERPGFIPAAAICVLCDLGQVTSPL